MALALPQAVAQLHSWLMPDTDGENEKGDDKMKSKPKNVVYVHCQSGISRSATVVIAYLMKHYRASSQSDVVGLGLMSAYEIVYNRRPVINPNDGFFRALQHFGEHHCGIDYAEEGEDARVDQDHGNIESSGDGVGRREREVAEYNGYQIMAQLAFTGVTLPEAQAALRRCGGDVSMAASRVLSRFEHQNN